MLSNSEFIIMLNQAFSDRAKLSKLLNISDEQMSYVTNADAGCGLIKYGSALVPFINRFPQRYRALPLDDDAPRRGCVRQCAEVKPCPTSKREMRSRKR